MVLVGSGHSPMATATRRVAITLVALALLTALASATAADRRLNFLFVYTDDQRWDAMGVVQRELGERGRYPWFATPAMDRLAAEAPAANEKAGNAKKKSP